MRTRPSPQRLRSSRPGLAALVVALAATACLRGAPSAEAAAAPPLLESPDGRPLTLTFADDFKEFRPYANGKGVWRTTYKDGRAADEFELRTLKGNKEVQLYVDPEFMRLGLNPFRIVDGHLEIRAEPAPPQAQASLRGYRYVSGLISTQPSFSQTYGYFEMRAKLPAGKGLWPAFWLLPEDLSWPPEVDIMESVGDPSKYYVTYHSAAARDSGTETPIAPNAFHVFAVSWDRENVVWYLDGREVKRLPTPADMHKPMFMIANLALGGDWAGYPDATTPFPATYEIDYIRAYRFVR